MEIPIYYDPMIAKLITYGKTRAEAIARMGRAIDEYQITGIQTTLGFGKFVMGHEAFTSGHFDTHFVNKYFNPESLKVQDPDEALMAAIFAASQISKPKFDLPGLQPEKLSNWRKNRVNH